MTVPTGPTRSGMNISRSTIFPRIKKKPRRVTILGANQRGKISTKAFHYAVHPSAPSHEGVRRDRRCGTYIVFQDISRNEGLVHALVLVALER